MKKYVICGLLVLVLVLPVIVKAQNNTNIEEVTAALLQKIEQLKQQIAELQKQLTKVEQQVQEIIKFSKILRKGETNEEVKRLQEFLKTDPEVYPEGAVTGYFGSLTEKAVKKFQEKHADDVLKPLGLSEGTGVVGAKTIETMNKVLEEKNKSGEIPPALLQPTETAIASPEERVIICHIPDGNINNRQTITIGKSALEAHLKHGDAVGTCTPSVQPTTPVACTADAKLCPDGSYVSRIAPKCEFAPCPNQPATQYSITVLSPNGGEIWATGSSQYIKWSTNIPFNYKILTIRLRDSSGVEYNLSENTENDMVEQITVPTTLAAGAYKLEIKTIAGDQTVFDSSDTTFNIVAPTATITTPVTTSVIAPVKIEGPFFLKILYPNGGEQLEAGKTHEVYWTTTSVPLNARMVIRIVLLGGSYIYDPPEFSNLTNTGKASWAIPENMYPGSYRVDASVSFGNSLSSDASDNSFKIISPGSAAAPSLTVVSPNGGETWYMGKTYDILWKSSGVNRVNIEVNVSKDGTPVGTLSIAGSDMATPAISGKYSWTLNSNHLKEGNQFKIVVRNAEAPYTPEDGSDNYFSVIEIPTPTLTPTPIPTVISECQPYWWYDNTHSYCQYGKFCGAYMYQGLQTFSTEENCKAALIGKTLTLVSPNGGEKWITGNAYNIAWKSSGIEKVNINIFNTRSLYSGLGLGTFPASQGSYFWTIPADFISARSVNSGWASGDGFQILILEEKADRSFGIEDKSDGYVTIVSGVTPIPTPTLTPTLTPVPTPTPTITSSPTPMPAPTCTDTDNGYDFTKYGEVTDYLFRTYQDACIPDLSGLSEFTCRTDGLYTSQFHSCVNDGKICSNGACIAAAGNSWCKDSDGGYNFDQSGIVEYSVEGKNYTSADYCSGEQGVVETACNNKQWTTQYHSCVNDGKICKNGACVASAEISSCNDSDGGYDFTKFGVVEYSVAGVTSKTEDTCSSIYELNEVACSGNQKTSQFHSCKEDGKICQNGACIFSPSAVLPDESTNQLASALNSLSSLLDDLLKILK